MKWLMLGTGAAGTGMGMYSSYRGQQAAAHRTRQMLEAMRQMQDVSRQRDEENRRRAAMFEQRMGEWGAYDPTQSPTYKAIVGAKTQAASEAARQNMQRRGATQGGVADVMGANAATRAIGESVREASDIDRAQRTQQLQAMIAQLGVNPYDPSTAQLLMQMYAKMAATEGGTPSDTSGFGKALQALILAGAKKRTGTERPPTSYWGGEAPETGYSLFESEEDRRLRD